MRHLQATLVGDGTSDRCLVEALGWSIRTWLSDGERDAEFRVEFANGPGTSHDKVRRALAEYPAISSSSIATRRASLPTADTRD